MKSNPDITALTASRLHLQTGAPVNLRRLGSGKKTQEQDVGSKINNVDRWS